MRLRRDQGGNCVYSLVDQLDRPEDNRVSLRKHIWYLIGALGVLSFPLWSATIPGTGEELSAGFRGDEADPTSKFVVSVWRTGEGLPINDIQDLKDTPDGFLWIGTYRGLVRFDGVRFQSFLTTPQGARFGMRVWPLETDARGRFWVAPDQTGILRLDAGGFTEALTNGYVQGRVQSLCSDGGDGMMWVDGHGGLGRFSTEQPGEAEKIDGAASGLSRWVRDFEGQLWLVSPRSLKIYEKEGWRDVYTSEAMFVATPCRAGGMWIARDAKLWQVMADGTTREEATFPWKGQTRVNCLLEDSQRRLWIGTLAQGLFNYSSDQFKLVVPTPSSITCLLEDQQDNLWAGTRGGGLIRIRKREFFRHGLHTGLKNEFVRSLAQDTAGRVWLLAGDGGLGWITNGVWHAAGLAEGWPGIDSRSVLPSKDGGVWVSTYQRGLWRWSNGRFSRRKLSRPMPEPAMDMLEDHEGRLWMVTDNSGIFCLEKNKLTGYSIDDGLPSRHIRRIVEDEAGEILAGDWEGGIARFRDGHWKVVRKASGHQDAVRSMVATTDALWIGTSAGGLLRFKDGRTARISLEEGLPDVCIEQLLLDGRGSLWGGTPHTLFRISLAQLNAVIEGREQNIGAITYGRSDGLPDLSFANWCDPRSWHTSDGELWFATANGAIHFQPENLQQSRIPQILLEQTLLDGKPVGVAALQQLRLGPGRLDFRFTAPCLTAPERVRFRYQMTGVDPDWVDAGTARSATYTGIPAGKHVFRVLASSPDGVWGSKPATVTLAVHPFFWQTNWFLALIVGVTAGGGVWTARRATVQRLSRRLEKLRQQRVLDQERARIAQDIHDELGANLTSIGLLADLGARHKSDPVAVTHELDQISQTARESVAAMDAIVWALNPRNDSLDNFANYVAQFTRDFFRPTELRTRLEIPANLPAQPLTSDTRHQLFLLVKETFNNIVRHAEATEVNLKIACDDRRLRLIIEDNGKGLSRKTVKEGQRGLANLRGRIERLGGSLWIESNDGQGTRLEFVLPPWKT
ncbi:MAG: hypothetical protein H0X66_21630 [Verrucomicrobia bacterium]|nr:hypothetical protein [Verrucomicrobiota bacterium]